MIYKLVLNKVIIFFKAAACGSFAEGCVRDFQRGGISVAADKLPDDNLTSGSCSPVVNASVILIRISDCKSDCLGKIRMSFFKIIPISPLQKNIFVLQ